MIKRKKLKIS